MLGLIVFRKVPGRFIKSCHQVSSLLPWIESGLFYNLRFADNAYGIDFVTSLEVIPTKEL